MTRQENKVAPTELQVNPDEYFLQTVDSFGVMNAGVYTPQE
ncbi:MAG TPA: hypothetical protein VI757_01000 [Bacteroidia bacterium]|nr:hypothetical protein [Bacteroidia bacterium]